MTQQGHLDTVDYQILNILQQDARTDAVQISRQVHKTPAAVGKRIGRLKEQGYILGFMAVLDRHKVGRPTLIALLVRLKANGGRNLLNFVSSVQQLPEIIGCMHVAGEYDFLLHIALAGQEHYEPFLLEKLLIMPMVERVQSLLVLNDYKRMAILPLTVIG